MKKTIVAGVLAAVVFAAVALVLIITHIDRGVGEDEFDAFSDPAFPTVSFSLLGMQTEPLAGYTDIDDSLACADMLLPIHEDRIIEVTISDYATVPSAVYVCLQNGDGDRLIDKTEITMEHKNGVMTGQYCLSALTETGEKYYLTIISTDRTYGDVYYSTWVESFTDEYWDNKSELVGFATDFSDAALEGDRDTVSSYVKYDKDKAGTDLGYVNMYSDSTLVTWGGLAPTVQERYISVYEWSESQLGMRLSYKAASDAAGEENKFLVKEDFTIREREDKLYLLNYERNTREIFAGNENSIGTTSILLGVQSAGNMDCIYTDYGVQIYFSVDGGVWHYNYNKDTLTNIFAFGDQRTDERVDRDGTDITMIGENGGVIYFCVKGYQASGRHEGEIGLSVYGYNADDNETTECFYARLHGELTEIMEENGRLAYINEAGLMFINIGSDIYTMDLTGLEPVKARTGIDVSTLMVSENGKIAAWKDAAEEKICILDMDTDTMNVVKDQGEIDLAGFVRDDIVYLKKSDTVKEKLGFTLQEYYSSLEIVEKDLTLKTDYCKNGILISGVTLTDEGLIIHRCALEDGALTDIQNDVLSVAGEQSAEGLVDIKIATSEIKRNYYYINLGRNRQADSELKIEQVELSATMPAALNDEVYAGTEGKYFAYSRGKLALCTDDLTEAVEAVYDTFGCVYLGDRMDKPVWDRGTRAIYLTIKLPKMSWTAEGQEEVLAAMGCMERAVDIFAHAGVNAGVITTEEAESADREKATSVKDELQTVYGDKLLVFTDCDINKVLYYINLEHPVLVLLDDDTAVIITGYTQNDVQIYDPMTRQTTTYSQTDAAAWFTENDAVMVTFP